MKMPVSIWQFERVLLLSVAVDLFNHASNLRHTSELLSDPVLREVGFGWTAYLIILMSGAGLFTLIWYFIVKRASNAARWTYSTLVVVGSIQLFSKMAVIGEQATLQFVFIGIAVHVLSLYATWLLWRPDCREWFVKGVGKGEVPARHRRRYQD